MPESVTEKFMPIKPSSNQSSTSRARLHSFSGVLRMKSKVRGQNTPYALLLDYIFQPFLCPSPSSHGYSSSTDFLFEQSERSPVQSLFICWTAVPLLEM